MFPAHCKEVSVKSVDFELTEKSILSFLEAKHAYIRTKYYVFNNGTDWAVASVEKKDVNSVLQPITTAKVVALPADTSFVEDPSLEVLSASMMGKMRESKGTRCIVVKGRAEHVSFFVDEEPREITIFDVVPPSPSKLLGLVNSVLESDLQDRYIRTRLEQIDLNDIARRSNARIVMFPCKASGLRTGGKTLYLDGTPELTPSELDEVTLVGCSLSARIFKAVYDREPRLVNMCPLDLVKEMGVHGHVLVKCCRVKQGFESDGNILIVPWGARAPEVSAALRSIVG
jgi:hypothetical protein